MFRVEDFNREAAIWVKMSEKCFVMTGFIFMITPNQTNISRDLGVLPVGLTVLSPITYFVLGPLHFTVHRCLLVARRELELINGSTVNLAAIRAHFPQTPSGRLRCPSWLLQGKDEDDEL